MNVIDAEATLKAQISKARNTRMRIVTAYVTDVLETLHELINHNCRVEIVTGTMDCFNHPKHLAQIGALPGVELRVDFRRQNSVHWKLYLVEPSDVIIGSPNFTGRGLETSRDIAVFISDPKLYGEFEQRINGLLNAPRVVKFGGAAYKRELALYEVDFENAQRHRRATTAAGSTSSFWDWLADERNQELKLFVWEDLHSEAQKKRAQKIAAQRRKAAGVQILVKSPIREFFTTTRKRPPFKSGDVVLCCKANGAYMNFFRLDLIERGTDGLLYMIDTKSSRPAHLFDVREAKVRIAKYIQENNFTGSVTLTRPTLLMLFT